MNNKIRNEFPLSEELTHRLCSNHMKSRTGCDGGCSMHPQDEAYLKELVELERQAELGRAVEWATELRLSIGIGISKEENRLLVSGETTNYRYIELLEAYRQSQKEVE